MARSYDGDELKLGPWTKGANNVAQEASVPANQARVLSNVDLTDEGKPRRRQGVTQILSRPDSHSIWSDGSRMYYASADTLYAIIDGEVDAVVTTGLSPDEPLAYVLIEPYVYVSDGYHSWRVSGTSAEPWGVPVPAHAPSLTASATGGLAAGRYQATITFAMASGEESGAPTPNVVDVGEGGGIAMADFPPPPANVTRVRIYMTKQNGSELLFAGAAPYNVTSINVGERTLGRKLQTIDMEPLPAANEATYYNGRLYIARDTELLWSEALAYSIYSPEFNRLPFLSSIKLLAAMPAGGKGIFCATDTQTYFLFGDDPAEFKRIEAHPYGAVPGSMTMVPAEELAIEGLTYAVPVWLSNNGGFVAGLPNGTVQVLTGGRYSAPRGDRAASLFRSERGISQVITAIRPPVQASPVGMTDSVSMTVTRNGINI